ncbi:hypothetical protein PIB30_037624, partial [Stylosanthes scabra]|nr:hypothetical protein [Stylosanthes scabra]
MNPSCRFSSTTYTTSSLPKGWKWNNSHVFISRNTNPFFINDSRKHGASTTIPTQRPKGPSFAILRIKGSKLCHHPFATLSSFAEAEGEEEHQQQEIQLNGHHQQQQNDSQEKKNDGELPGFAQAFNISPSTAFAISACLAVSALTFP